MRGIAVEVVSRGQTLHIFWQNLLMGEMWNERRVKDNFTVLGSDNWKKEAHTDKQKTKGIIHLFLKHHSNAWIFSVFGVQFTFVHVSRVLSAQSTSLIYFSNLFEDNFNYTRQMLKFVSLAPAWINIQFIPNTNAAITICPRHAHFPIPLSPQWPSKP